MCVCYSRPLCFPEMSLVNKSILENCSRNIFPALEANSRSFTHSLRCADVAFACTPNQIILGIGLIFNLDRGSCFVRREGVPPQHGWSASTLVGIFETPPPLQ